MAETTALDLIRGLYDYHWWANRRLVDAVQKLGDEAADRELGKHFSFPTLRGTFIHIYGADWAWLERWQGRAPAKFPAAEDFPTLAVLRQGWDGFEKTQRAFIGALTPADLGRVVEFTSTAYPSKDGEPYRLPLAPLLQHVANHATHHRSEIATMHTMLSGSPPGTDLSRYLGIVSGMVRDA